MTKNKILATKPQTMQDMVMNAPLLPGCYIYRNGKGKILYIGKAKVLRNRVKSYFSNYKRVEEKIRQMIDRAQSIEFLITDSEIEALILEIMLIKKYKPKYNTMHVDDKNYVYVKFEKVKATPKGQKANIPTVSTTRQKLKDGAEYFGPYPDSRAINRLLRRLRRVFPYPTRPEKVTIPRLKSDPIISHEPRASFHAQIGLSPDFHSEEITRGEYENNINSIKKIFAGEKSTLTADLEKQMKQAAKDHKFEQAARLRNMLHDIKYAGSNLRIDSDTDEVAIMKEKKERRLRAQAELVERLQFPEDKMHDHKGFRMECYDISNFQGKSAVGSMVVFVDGQPKPDLYRRFKIRMKNEPNDFAMLQEVLTRRFNQFLGKPNKNWKPDESFSQKPDLIIIDGGKGQLSSTFKILQGYGLADDIPIVGLAKQEEEIFKMAEQFDENARQDIDFDWDTAMLHDKITHPDSEFSKIRLPRRSESLYLVQRIRDEAHRFAITYHRKLRSKLLKESLPA